MSRNDLTEKRRSWLEEMGSEEGDDDILYISKTQSYNTKDRVVTPPVENRSGGNVHSQDQEVHVEGLA